MIRPLHRLPQRPKFPRWLRRSLGPALAAGGLLGLPACPAFAQPAPPAAAEQPAVEDGFLLTEPEESADLLRASLMATRLGRPNLARQYLQKLVDADLDDDTLLKLRDEFGPAAFAQLSNAPELRPLSTDLADQVARAFRERGANPERIAALIDKLSQGTAAAGPSQQALVNAGLPVVPALIARFRTENDEFVLARVRDTLVRIGTPALPPLHAALDAPTDSVQVQALTTLGRIGDRASLPHLLFPAFGPEQPVGVRAEARRALAAVVQTSRSAAATADPADVAERLRTEALRSLTAEPPERDPLEPAAEGVTVWAWDAAAGTVRAAQLDRQGAALFRGGEFAREAFLTAPDRKELQSLYLAFLLGLDAWRAGSQVPPTGPGTAYDTLLAAGPETAADVLRLALRHNVPRAAAGAVGVLGQTGSAAALLSPGTGPLIDALDAADPRVQLAAAVAALRLEPTRPFPGSSRVVDILARTLATGNVPTAVIIDPKPERAATLAGFMRGLGYDAVARSTGQEGFRTASEQMVPDLVVVNANVSRWPLDQTLANLRADARTKGVPVVVVGPLENAWAAPAAGLPRFLSAGHARNDPRQAVGRTLSDVPGTEYVTATVTSDAFARQVRPALARLAAVPLTPDERRGGRGASAYWLGRIAAERRTDVFPLGPAETALLEAVGDPVLADDVLTALTAVPTMDAQSAIAGVALMGTLDARLRRTAVETLVAHVRRHGLLVPAATVEQLRRVAEGTDDPGLQAAFAGLWGVLRPSNATVRAALEAAPLPPLP